MAEDERIRQQEAERQRLLEEQNRRRMEEDAERQRLLEE